MYNRVQNLYVTPPTTSSKSGVNLSRGMSILTRTLQLSTI